MTHSNLFRDNSKKTLFQENQGKSFKSGGATFSKGSSVTTPKNKEDMIVEQLENKLKKKSSLPVLSGITSASSSSSSSS
jgi:hypothetical protein